MTENFYDMLTMFRSGGGNLEALFERKSTPLWRSFLTSPLKTLAKTIYRLRQAVAKQAVDAIDVVCISDTHNLQPKIPHGDLLIHAGDLTQSGSIQELQTALDWLKSLPHPHKVLVAGNHDVSLQSSEKSKLNWEGLTYLEESATSIKFSGGRVVTLYGSPWTRKHGNWAFQYPGHEDVWTNTLPSDLDILVTHCPPRFHLDIDGFGDENLLGEIRRTQPALHVFGHLHAGYGQDVLLHDDFEVLYESLYRGSAGFTAVLKMLYHLIRFKMGFVRGRGTILVNASAVGGLRDTLVRTSITVRI